MQISAKDLFDKAVQFLKENKYDTQEAKSVIFWLLEHTLHLSKTDILSGKSVFYEDFQAVLENALQRLAKHEPIQYILEKTEFFGRTFKVSPDVLIPRPETEELISVILKEHTKTEGLRVLDIGTGSGCIAVTLAKELVEPEVYALDVSEKALRITQENAENNQARVYLVETSILDTDFDETAFDIIVSNPPYIKEEEKQDMSKNVLDYEPALALFVPDEQPLLFYEAITVFAKDRLVAGGKLYFEINAQFGQETKALMESKGFKQIEIIQDINGKDRMVRGEKGI